MQRDAQQTDGALRSSRLLFAPCPQASHQCAPPWNPQCLQHLRHLRHLQELVDRNNLDESSVASGNSQ